METLKALILTIVVLNLVSRYLSFYYTVIFTLFYDISNFCFFFIDSGSRSCMFVKAKLTRKHLYSNLFFHEVVDCRPAALLTIRDSDTAPFL